LRGCGDLERVLNLVPEKEQAEPGAVAGTQSEGSLIEDAVERDVSKEVPS
jgi:hypothetical protein